MSFLYDTSDPNQPDFWDRVRILFKILSWWWHYDRPITEKEQRELKRRIEELTKDAP